MLFAGIMALVATTGSVALDLESGDDLGTVDWHIASTIQLAPDRTIVRGTLADGSGTVTLAVHGEATAGVIRMDDGDVWRVTPSGLADVPEPTSTCDAIPGVTRRAGGIASEGNCDDGSTVDVLVVYTAAARSAAGGTAQILAEIDLAVAEANTAFANSALGVTINLVHAEEIPYAETGPYNGHLFRLTDPDDGIMDSVHDLRTMHGADLVDLMVADGSSCGSAWIMTQNDHDFESSAFSVTTWFCAAANLSFAHELAHNMGCHHDRADADGEGLFDYSFGHRFSGQSGLWRTVMGITTPATRIPYFSNPAVIFDGAATGVAAGDPASADNASTIEASVFTVANFRCDPSLCEPPPGPVTDCNINGLPDDCDLALGFSDDIDGSGIPDECEKPINDECQAGQLIFDGTHDFSNIVATTSVDEHCLGPQRDVWFRYIAQCDGWMSISTCGSGLDTEIAVYDGCPDAGGGLLVCASDGCGDEAAAVVRIIPGLYQVRVGTADGSIGTGTLTVSCSATPPCPADLDLDGMVTVLDVLQMLGVWNSDDRDADIAPEGGDGIVNILDLLVLLGAWGPC